MVNVGRVKPGSVYKVSPLCSTILAQQTGSDILWFLYDSDGTRVGFTYNGMAYYNTTNAQGDVTGITDSNCNTVVEYTYDAWGKLLSTTGSMADFIGTDLGFIWGLFMQKPTKMPILRQNSNAHKIALYRRFLAITTLRKIRKNKFKSCHHTQKINLSGKKDKSCVIF